MKHGGHNWDLRRRPSTAERVVGICCSSVIALVSLVLCVASVRFLLREPAQVGAWVLAISLNLLLLSVWFVYRFVFTPPEALNERGALRLGHFVVGLGLVQAFLFFMLPMRGSSAWPLLAVGAAGVGGGIANIRRVKKGRG